MDRRLIPQLSGVPETMLWPLYGRAAEARRGDAMLHDPWSVEIADAIDYDYARSFGRPDFAHAMRAMIFDGLLRDWLRDHPGGLAPILGVTPWLKNKAPSFVYLRCRPADSSAK